MADAQPAVIDGTHVFTTAQAAIVARAADGALARTGCRLQIVVVRSGSFASAAGDFDPTQGIDARIAVNVASRQSAFAYAATSPPPCGIGGFARYVDSGTYADFETRMGARITAALQRDGDAAALAAEIAPAAEAMVRFERRERSAALRANDQEVGRIDARGRPVVTADALRERLLASALLAAVVLVGLASLRFHIWSIAR